ncbi:folate/biopterin family MFS transporter [Paralimibaculum aggregatum]|uniref:Folate/biopterin family MFS transporter n=1 Tax=Paralimibaculum aggregatum TaxID=3036245 RepID=A0ABQ6LP67_9RHOB|nr:hypothetical protein [Limibaculum sp. NKW23]GMG83512.1 folate/biopterin family MFS transporter [Limibaculum sp. NKW23]
MARAVGGWIERTFVDLAREMRWSFLPPLMVYFAAGVAGLTSVVGAFFVKDHLDLDASFLAGLTFWAGLPWVLKMPLGHLVDLIWRRKAALVLLGAALIAASLLIMYGLIAERAAMAAVLPVEVWYVTSVLLAPSGYVVQDVVADAMTVEAVPEHDREGNPIGEAESKRAHTTMQTLGRFAIISGLVGVAALNIFMFDDVAEMSAAEKAGTYADIYLIALAIPVLSVTGVAVAAVLGRRRAAALRAAGLAEARVDALVYAPAERTRPDWAIFAGGGAFVVLSLGLGTSEIPYSAELVFAATLGVVLFLIGRLTRVLPVERARALVGTAAIIFVFRAVPLPGPGLTWFEIDVLRFDERFLSVLSLVTSCLTLFGMVVLRPLMATWSIARIVALLTLVGGVLSLPNIGLYYGLHEWTAAHTAGIVDARFIAILDTAIESPLGQVAMIPMLAWIARNAPVELKATFFAVMASFTNLALSASSLLTKHLNAVFVVTRETETVAADYSALGMLLVVVALIGVVAPLGAILVVQLSRYRTAD